MPPKSPFKIQRRIYEYCLRREGYELPHEWKAEYRIAFQIVYRLAHGIPFTVDGVIEELDRSRYGRKIAHAKQDRLDYLAQAHIYPAGSFPPRKPIARAAAAAVVIPTQLKLFR